MILQINGTFFNLTIHGRKFMENKAIFKETLGPLRSPNVPSIIVELICSGCNKVLKRQEEFTKEEEEAYKGEFGLPAQTCNTQGIKCKRFNN
jgi:hypothetical protein